MLGLIIIFVGIVGLLVSRQTFHKWEYQNSSSRTCKVCGQHEEKECWGDDWEHKESSTPGTWEIFRAGDLLTHTH